MDEPDERVPADQLLGKHAGVAMRAVLKKLLAAKAFVNTVKPPNRATDEQRADALLSDTAGVAGLHDAKYPRQFLNRVMTLRHAVGQDLFERFVEALEEEINTAAARGEGLVVAQVNIDLSDAGGKYTEVDPVNLNGSQLRHFRHDYRMSWSEAEALVAKLIMSGASADDVFFNVDYELVHKRTRTTARVYSARNAAPRTVTVSYLADRLPDSGLSDLKDEWNELYDRPGTNSVYVAQLPALAFTAGFSKDSVVLARLVNKDGSRAMGVMPANRAVEFALQRQAAAAKRAEDEAAYAAARAAAKAAQTPEEEAKEAAFDAPLNFLLAQVKADEKPKAERQKGGCLAASLDELERWRLEQENFDLKKALKKAQGGAEEEENDAASDDEDAKRAKRATVTAAVAAVFEPPVEKPPAAAEEDEDDEEEDEEEDDEEEAPDADEEEDDEEEAPDADEDEDDEDEVGAARTVSCAGELADAELVAELTKRETLEEAEESALIDFIEARGFVVSVKRKRGD